MFTLSLLQRVLTDTQHTGVVECIGLHICKQELYSGNRAGQLGRHVAHDGSRRPCGVVWAVSGTGRVETSGRRHGVLGQSVGLDAGYRLQRDIDGAEGDRQQHRLHRQVRNYHDQSV